MLLFRSLYRYKNNLIPAKEFANVVGRVGRAFVDLDGIYALPLFDSIASKKREFFSLIAAARKRQLESGVRLLIDLVGRILGERLNVSREQLIEYVTNMRSPWVVKGIDEKDKYPGLLQTCLNELDAAILGVVDTLDLPVDQVADYLDACLRSSYWQRSLQRTDDGIKRLQEAVVRGRAGWLWTHTTEANRKGYFAAGIGYVAGKEMDDNAATLGERLSDGEDALATADIERAVASVVELATILFRIGPFVPENNVDNWPELLGDWLRGRALNEFADNEGVSFLQEDVVFRLVWGVEAARLYIAQISSSNHETQNESNLAMCLTYGVPNKHAALFMQTGMASRTLACKVAEATGGSLNDISELKEWIISISQGKKSGPTWVSEDDKAEWERFLQRFDHREQRKWKRHTFVLPVEWHGKPCEAGTRVRISFNSGDSKASVLGVSLNQLGETIVPAVATTHFFGIVRDDEKSLDVSFFGL